MNYWEKLTDANKKHLAGLDHLRALAIILVFLCHYRAYKMPLWVDVVGRFGWTGVDLFFVLSGFLIGEQLLRQIKNKGAINFKQFYISRTFRILPAYFFIVLVYFLFPVLRERDGIAPLWQFLTFTQNFDLDFGNEGSFSHAWSLAIEEQFYVLLPLSICLSAKNRHIKKGFYLLAGVFLFGLLVRCWSWIQVMNPFYIHDITDGRFVAYNKWVYYPTYNRLDGLMAGVAIAGIMTFSKKLSERIKCQGNWLLASGTIGLIIAYFFLKEDRLDFWPTLIGYPLLALAFGLMVFGAILPSCFLYHIRWKFSTVIAALSYSIYLSHKMVNEALQTLLDYLGLAKESNVRVLLCACGSILVAFLINRCIEYPFMKWRKKILTQQKRTYNGVVSAIE